MPKLKASSITEYLEIVPEVAIPHIKEIRALLCKVAPNAIETIKWGVPVYEEKRILFSYSAAKAHLNFMPIRSSLAPFEKELADFKTGKDTIQIPYNKPFPKNIILMIAKHREHDVRVNDARWM